jgi:purine-binding chemotaxis protein CheW
MECTEQLSDTKELGGVRMQNMQQAIFFIGEEKFGFDIMDVNIIEKVIPVEQVANSPKNVKGIIRLRGDVIPVYSLRKKFGLQDLVTNEETRFIITDSNGILMAYEVDKMHEISQLTPEQMYELPSVLKSNDTTYIKSITNLEDRLVLLLDHNGILTEEEQKNIKSILQKLQEKNK